MDRPDRRAPDHPSDANFVADFQWNEVRLQSGENQGESTGFEFDGLLIEKELPLIGANYYCGQQLDRRVGAIEAIGATSPRPTA